MSMSKHVASKVKKAGHVPSPPAPPAVSVPAINRGASFLAAKHFDPQVGIDVHSYQPPPPLPPLPPVPLPSPHIGTVFDPFDYLPTINVSPDNPLLKAVAGAMDSVDGALDKIGASTRAPQDAPPEGEEVTEEASPESIPIPLGATVEINGVRRANAGTMGICSHIPVGNPVPPPFAPGGMQFDDELFMGCKTVLTDGEPLSHIVMPVLSCAIVGSIPPFRLRKAVKPIPRSLVLPTTANLALFTNVLVGWPPTISFTAMLFRLGLKALGKALKGIGKIFQGVAFNTIGRKLKLPPPLCKIFYGHPVDIRNGSVMVENVDFKIPGRLPLVWPRHYSSAEERVGACGRGWDTLADLRLELLDDGSVSFLGPDQVALFPWLPPENTRNGKHVTDLFDGAHLLREPKQWVVQTKDGLRYLFACNPQAPTGVPARPGVLSLIERIEDACGNHWRFERRDGRLVRIVEGSAAGPSGRVIEVQSSPEGLIEALTLFDPATTTPHRLVTYRYTQGNLEAAIDELGAAQRFAYVEHHMVRDTNRMGLSFHYAYDERWRVVHTWGDGGLYDYRFAYDERLRQTEITDSSGHTTVVTFDENNLPLCEVDPLGGVTIFEYDDAGRTVAVTGPGGLRTCFDYDTYGNPLCITLPDGSSVSTAYNEDHKPVSMTDPEGGEWRQEWDACGNLTCQTTPSGVATLYEYTKQGDLLHVTSPIGQRTTLDYDTFGFLAGLTDATGQRTQFQHDTFGNLRVKQLANGDTTHYRYDAKNRLLESVLPDSKRIKCSYDAEDNLTHYLDETGRETLLTYYRKSLQSRTDPDGSKVEYHYDTEEQLIGVSNQKGQRWHLKRDAVGRLIEEIDYWGQSRQYAYDPTGYLSRSTDPLGQTLTITCDKLGRITRKQASEQDAETYRYNKRGQLIEAKNPFSTIKRQYGKDGQLTQEKQQQPNVNVDMDYAYNPIGQLIEQTQQFKHQQEARFKHSQKYTYNALGQPDSMQVDGHEPIRFMFDDIGRLTNQHLSEHLTQHYEYNAAGQLSNQANMFKGQLQTCIDYDYDDTVNLIRRHDNRLGADQYRYDLLGQIVAHADPTGKVRQFVYDKTGNRFKSPHEDEQGRTLQHDDGSYWRLDKAGQLVQKQDAQGENTFLKWDAYGRLRSLKRQVTEDMHEDSEETLIADAYGMTPVAKYLYDALGRRVCKIKITPQRNAPDETTWFVWDGDVMVGELKQAQGEPQHEDVGWDELVNPNGSTARQPEPDWQAQFYSYHLGSFVPLAMQIQILVGKGVRKSLCFYQNDPNGMPLRLQDENGVIAWEAHYMAFGQVDRRDAILTQPLRLQGQYFDSESGLHYNRHRYYDPGAGLFISSDPLGLEGGLNPYQFAANVLGWIDPLGLVEFDLDLFPRGDVVGSARQNVVLTGADGHFIVGGHGWGDRPAISSLYMGSEFDGKPGRPRFMPRTMTAIELAQMIRWGPTGYRPGTPIVLFSCHLGGSQIEFARQLANALGVDVWAPNGKINARGAITADKPNTKGEWVRIRPGTC
jgi:RHS repeat-associated protein